MTAAKATEWTKEISMLATNRAEEIRQCCVPTRA